MKRLLTAVALGITAAGAGAQEAYPSRPVTIVVPNPPGGMNQVTAQPLSAAIEKLYKQPAPVINKPGGTGAVGAAYVANSKPDGYTILVTVANLSLVVEKNKVLGTPAPYKLEQLAPVALTSADPVVMAVQAGSPWKTVKEFVAEAKAKPGQLAYATSGPYGITHVPFEMFMHAAGIKMRHVPTTGGGPAITQLLGGHVQATGGGVSTIARQQAAGKFRALATWGTTRHPALADTPTFKELGYDVEAYLWVGLFTAAGTPEPVFTQMREMVRKAIADPLYQDTMKKINVVVDYRDAPEFKKFFDEDHKRLAAAVQRIGKLEQKQ